MNYDEITDHIERKHSKYRLYKKTRKEIQEEVRKIKKYLRTNYERITDVGDKFSVLSPESLAIQIHDIITELSIIRNNITHYKSALECLEWILKG